MHTTTDYIKPFKKLGLKDLALVGGKNASLGEMYQNLRSSGINVTCGPPATITAVGQCLRHNRAVSIEEATRVVQKVMPI